MRPLVLFRLVGGDPSIRFDDPEPSLSELLDDSILHLLMQSDRVRPAELRRIIAAAQARLRPHQGRGRAVPAAAVPAACVDCQA
jgi:hypothetical protein